MSQSAMFSVVPKKRKVWVLNRHTSKAYVEKYRDTEYVIPPNSEKKVIMDLLTAEKFLSQGTALQEFDNAGREISMGKPIYWQDLTDDERTKLDPVSASRLKEEEKEASSVCSICGETLPTVKGLSLHTKRRHPEYEPVKEL